MSHPVFQVLVDGTQTGRTVRVPREGGRGQSRAELNRNGCEERQSHGALEGLVTAYM